MAAPMTDIPALETLLASGLAADPVAAETALLSSTLYVVPFEGAVIAEGEPFRLSGLVLKDGQQATAAFTRPELAEAVYGAPADHAIRGQHLLEAFPGGWFVLNPGHERGLVLAPETATAILARATGAAPLPAIEEIEVYAPNPVPTALVAALKTALNGSAVRAAWLGRTRDPQTGQVGWRIELRGAITAEQARALVTPALAPFDLGGEPIDLVTAAGGGDDAPGVRVI